MLLAVADRALYLQQGRLIAHGPTHEVLSRYGEDCDAAALGDERDMLTGRCSKPARPAGESAGLDILEVCLDGSDGRSLDWRHEAETWRAGRPASIRLRVRCHRPIHDGNLTVAVRKLQGDNECLFTLSSREDRQPIHLPPGDHEIAVRLPACGLPGGASGMKLRLDEPGLFLLDMIDWDRLYFRVEADATMQNCSYYQPREWITSPAAPANTLAADARRLAS
jgi:hypothetical protein